MDYSVIPSVLQPAPTKPTPLTLIGGVQTPKVTASPEFHPYTLLKNAFFDWYQCALSVDPQVVVSAAESWFRSESNMCVEVRPAVPQRPYKSAVELFTTFPSHEIVFCTVHFGGVNQKCMFRSTSDRASSGSDFVRSVFPDHSCSRVDCALDFMEGPELFPVLVDWLVNYAQNSNPKMTVDYRGDWSNASKGRTIYIGSRQSSVFIRLYEKGFQQISEGNLDADPDWIRFEAEIKPEKKIGKIALSKLSPEQCFGCSRLLRDFVKMISGDKLEAVTVGKVRKMTDHDRSYTHLCYQYGRILLDELELTPDPEEFINKLLTEIKRQKENRSQCREKLAGIRENFVPIRHNASSVSVPSDPLPARPMKLYSVTLERINPRSVRRLKFRSLSLESRLFWLSR